MNKYYKYDNYMINNSCMIQHKILIINKLYKKYAIKIRLNYVYLMIIHN